MGQNRVFPTKRGSFIVGPRVLWIRPSTFLELVMILDVSLRNSQRTKYTISIRIRSFFYSLSSHEPLLASSTHSCGLCHSSRGAQMRVARAIPQYTCLNFLLEKSLAVLPSIRTSAFRYQGRCKMRGKHTSPVQTHRIDDSFLQGYHLPADQKVRETAVLRLVVVFL